MQDWIKLHRRFRESSFYGQAIPVALWIECLLRASWDKRERFIGREKVVLSPGEFVYGNREMGETIGCGTATVKAWMDLFEKEGMVERSPNAKGTVCKLKKWSEYQDTRTQKERSRNDDGTGAEPNKNIRNTNVTQDTVPGSVGIVVADAPTPSQYAEKFFAKDPDTMKAEAEYFVRQGIAIEIVRQEFKLFGLYWSERTPGGKKFRWQTEKTFEVRRRLVTWFRNAAERSQKKSGGLSMPDFRSSPQ